MSSAGHGAHSLAFRVMRLCRPSFQIDTPLKFDLTDLIIGEDTLDDPIASSHQLPQLLAKFNSIPNDSSLTYKSRFLLNHPSDSSGLSGLLVLPQSFGAIYLGETFCSYISINNSSKSEARDVVIKAEMRTDRQRILLLDTSKSPVQSIRSGGRYDFIVEHDVKELGEHQLVCSALYSDGESERKFLPQYFKFIVANPLSVRTKVRVVKDTTFLEACIENHTKSNLYMDQVEFEPAQNWTATTLKADEHPSENNAVTREIYKVPVLIKAGGGIRNYLYQLKLDAQGSSQTKVEGSNVLGKFQIKWRTNLGEPGRLQTQQILGAPFVRKEIELQFVEVPSVFILEKPFLLHLKLTNCTDRNMGPFDVWLSRNDNPEGKDVVINGPRKVAVPEVKALSFVDFPLNLIATGLGIQKITGITVFETKEKKLFDNLCDLEIFVDSD